MPPNTEPGEIEKDLGLTPVTTPITEDQTAPDASAKPEDSAPATSSEQDKTEPAEGPKTMAEAITAALEGDKAEKDAETTTEGEKPKEGEADPAKTPDKNADPDTSKTAEDGEADDDPTEDELKAYQAKPAKRIKQLLHQRNEFRREAEGLREDAGHYRNIRSFMSEARLEDGEVAELFKVGRLLKGTDPKGFEEALDIVLPIAQNLLELTGRSLPKALREQVESGALTEEHAREQARLRTRATLAERERDEVRTTAETQQQQQAVTNHQRAVTTAVTTWEQRTRQSDPDFALKADAMRDAARAMVAERGAPKSPEEAVQFAQATYERVNKWFTAARPAPRPNRPAPQSGQTGNRSGHAPAPKSLSEAIRGALDASRST